MQSFIAEIFNALSLLWLDDTQLTPMIFLVSMKVCAQNFQCILYHMAFEEMTISTRTKLCVQCVYKILVDFGNIKIRLWEKLRSFYLDFGNLRIACMLVRSTKKKINLFSWLVQNVWRHFKRHILYSILPRHVCFGVESTSPRRHCVY